MRRGQSPHKRRTGPMLASLRCGAKTRAGAPCRSPAVRGRHRCRMHGGARGSGAPRGNRNAVKHGLYTSESLAYRRRVNRILRDGADLLRRIEKKPDDPVRPPDHTRRPGVRRTGAAHHRQHDGPPGGAS